MLTISQLASYTGVTVRAVRHYHQVGLLPEPERDHSGYRNYGADDVVRLIKIRTLAEAGVPLTRVPELLDADPETFADAVKEIDKNLRSEIRRLQRNRKEVARLAAGESLALPDEVVDYLQALRDLGVSEKVLEPERDAWIIIAAQYPENMPEMMADKFRQLEDPRIVKLYLTIGDPDDLSPDDPRLEEIADMFSEITDEAERRGELEQQDELIDDTRITEMLDSFAEKYGAIYERLSELMRERGWTGWTQMKRAD